MTTKVTQNHQPKRLGMAFHETLKLNRAAMGDVLNYVQQCTDSQPSPSDLRNATSLGTNYVKAMPRFCNGAGLLNGWALTEFGRGVLQWDEGMLSPTSQWLLHYHLSAHHGPGPEFWHHLILRFLKPGTRLTSTWVRDELVQFAESHQRTEISQRTASSTASVFLNSYSKSEGLGELGVVRATGREYSVHFPQSPSALTFAYALVKFWQGRWQNQRTVNLADLVDQEGLAGLFFLSSQQVEQLLDEIRREGLIDIYRSSPPYQVVRQWTEGDTAKILERAYDHA